MNCIDVLCSERELWKDPALFVVLSIFGSRSAVVVLKYGLVFYLTS
jgi:hypothetical protein